MCLILRNLGYVSPLDFLLWGNLRYARLLSDKRKVLQGDAKPKFRREEQAQ